MALQQAQLASLPSMNLARYVPSHTYIEPAWHKALSAFLVGSAGTAGQDLAKNAMSPDYTSRAVAAGVAPAGSQSPSFLQKTVGGPNWTEQGVDAASKLKEETTRDKMMDEKYAAQLGISRDQLDSLNKSREDQLAQRKEDQGNRDSDRQDALSEKSAEADDRMQSRNDQLDRLTKDDAERKRVDDSLIAEHTASAGKAVAETDPTFAGKKQAAAMMTMMQAMGIDPAMMGGKMGAKPSATTQSSVQPSNNSDSLDLSKLIGGAGTPSPTNAQSVAPSPNQVMQPVGGAPDPLSAREAQNAGTTATQPAQSGQSTPTPPQNLFLKQFLDGAATPGPYNVSPSQGAPGAQPSAQFDPDMLKRAAVFAQMMGAQGGIPGQGGMPNV